MNNFIFSAATDSKTVQTAAEILKDTYTVLPYPSGETTHLLLNVPSLAADGSVIGAGPLDEVLSPLSKDVTIIGGNLRHPKLMGYKTIDLLQDPYYLTKNAAITAQCALRYALTELPVVIVGCSVLILGWGRIAKHLALLLKQLGADVTVAARKDTDRAMAASFGFRALKITAVEESDYAMIYNTIPYPVLAEGSSNTVKVDLASVPGMAGANVIQAKGLPGRFAPESSGKLIAETIIRLLQ